jgi:hypothetical protein
MGNTVGRGLGPQPLRSAASLGAASQAGSIFPAFQKQLAVLSSLPAANRDLDK